MHRNAEQASFQQAVCIPNLLSVDSGRKLMNGFDGDNGSHISHGGRKICADGNTERDTDSEVLHWAWGIVRM